MLERIASLAIPPAWQDVWICTIEHGHLQAVGTDAAGRRQYRYHDAWQRRRHREKFERVATFGARLESLRAVVREHLSTDGLTRDRVCAAAVRLLDVASLRVGGAEYARDHETYGVATLLRRHVRVQGPTLRLDFTAKSGQRVRIDVTEPDVASVVAALKRRRGTPELWAWREGRRWRTLRADDVNEYLKEHLGDHVSAKDFRTWNATVCAAALLAHAGPPSSERARARAVTEVVREVAATLGNTPAVCRSAYVDPRVLERFDRGEVADLGRDRALERREVEAAVCALLDERS